MTQSHPPSPSRNFDLGGFFAELIDSIGGAQRYALHAVFIGTAALAIWLTRSNLLDRIPKAVDLERLTAASSPSLPLEAASAPSGELPLLALAADDSGELTRLADIHTDIPSRPRRDVITYTVAKGDTLFGIAEKFGISPESIVWGNPILNDDPHSLRPDQQLRIPPVSGVLRDVQPGDNLKVLADFYGVTVEDVVSWPGNNLDPDNPQLQVGQLLMVPGGHREFVQWAVPQIIKTRRNVLPKEAGPGQCAGGYTGGAVGSGFFIWPVSNHWVSGNDYWAGHLGIDLAAAIGDPVIAADNGVVVFAGWSNWGYGNMVVLDHGNGWQTLYAHLSQWNVSCGQSVLQGNIIGLAGSTGNSTGPHLHFETNSQGSRPNPWNYLPAP